MRATDLLHDSEIFCHRLTRANEFNFGDRSRNRDESNQLATDDLIPTSVILSIFNLIPYQSVRFFSIMGFRHAFGGFFVALVFASLRIACAEDEMPEVIYLLPLPL